MLANYSSSTCTPFIEIAPVDFLNISAEVTKRLTDQIRCIQPKAISCVVISTQDYTTASCPEFDCVPAITLTGLRFPYNSHEQDL